jgi:hypothetical protein
MFHRTGSYIQETIICFHAICMKICMQFFQWYHEGEPFLQQIATDNKTWVRHYEPAS